MDKKRITIRLAKHVLLFFLLHLMGMTLVLAKVRLPNLISDRMVLQRDVELKIWGWADTGEKVTVRFRGEVYHTAPDETGKWFVTLPPQQAGGPFLMEVNEITIRDILIGDVWLCSGQSNMENPILRLTEHYPEINVSNNHMIRHFKVPTQDAVGETKEDIPAGGKWYSATASDVIQWTALAYFYAKEAYEHTNVPVGMLVSSLGGSAIQSWTSQEHLKEFPELLLDQEAWKALQKGAEDGEAKKWSAYDWNDSDWSSMEMPALWKDKGLDTKGTVYFRKDFELPDFMEGRYAKLYLGMLIDRDSVFVNGHLVGSTAYMYPPRNYPIPAGILKPGKNNITIRLTSPTGNGGFVADKPYTIVSDGVEINLTGEWKYKVATDLNELDPYRKRLGNVKTAGSGLYNGMIYPICDYKVKGAIWYQGESNAGDKNYEAYLKALLSNWRELYHAPDLPFLLVQLPNYLPKPVNPPISSGWAIVREAQQHVAREVPNTALAVTYDVGEWNDIHPLNKKDVAHRLFLGARKIVYGEELVSTGPVYKEMKIEGNKITLSFTEIGDGLQSRDGKLKHFAIAGADKKFVWADAVVKGNTVVVSSKAIKNPVAVRYAWSDNPEDANLINKEGLLASPFRTDDW